MRQVEFFREWRDLMRSWGFTVLEASGWETRDAEPRSTYLPGMLYLEHHDASTRLSGNWGALGYILANRLANIVTARDGKIMLCAAGVAWHAGVGSWPGIPTNGANTRSLGNEVCNSGSEPYSDACTRSIVAGEAAWAIVSGRDSSRVIGHKEWATPPGRKQDPRIDMYWRRRAVAAFTPPQEDEDMPTAKEIADEIWSRPVTGLDGNKYPIGATIQNMAWNAHYARVDAAVARKLAEESAKGRPLSQEDVQRISAQVAADLSEGYELKATPKAAQ